MREVKTFVHRIRKKLNIPWFTFHVLRHAFTSWSFQKGIRESITQKMLGHTTDIMTKRYRHFELVDDLQNEVNKLGKETVTEAMTH